MEKTLQELATLVGGRVVGDGSIVITETRSFEQAVKAPSAFSINSGVPPTPVKARTGKALTL